MGILRRGRGRPTRNGGKKYRLDVRMTDDELSVLNELIMETGKTKTDIVKEALDLYSKMVQSKRK